MSQCHTEVEEMPDLLSQVCGNGLLEGGCMDEEKLAKHKDEQVICFE